MDYKEKVLENKNITIKTEWNGGHIDYEVGNESTADGYDLWYFKENGEQIDICENVYYYENGVIEALQDFIENHSGESITIADWCEITETNDLDWDEIADNLGLKYKYEDEDEVIEWWEENELEFVKEQYEKDGVIDKVARAESFNNFTDALCKNGEISEEMYNEICLPDELLGE